MLKHSPSYQYRRSQYAGVQWSASHAKWHAFTMEKGCCIDLGLFQIEEDAARAVETAEFVSACPTNAADSPNSYHDTWQFSQPLKRCRSEAEPNSDSDHGSGNTYIPPPALTLPHGDSFFSGPSPLTSPSELPSVTNQPSPKRCKPRIGMRPNSASSTQERGPSPDEPAVETVKHKKQQSQFVGVSWHKYVKKWQSFIRINGKTVFLGYHRTEADAARAYDIAVIKHRGPSSTTNFDISHYKQEVEAAMPAASKAPTGATDPAPAPAPAALPTSAPPPLPPLPLFSSAVTTAMAGHPWHTVHPGPLQLSPAGMGPADVSAASAVPLAAAVLPKLEAYSSGDLGDSGSAGSTQVSDGEVPEPRGAKAGSVERTSRYRGVSWSKHCQKWRVQCCNNGKRVQVGYFDCEEEAARQYDRAAAEIQGLAAQTNFGYVHPCLFKAPAAAM